MNQKAVYDFDNVLARLVDKSERLEFRPDFGPEVYTGLVKIDGFLMAAIGNRQGLPWNYPEYTNEYAAGVYQNPRSICPQHHLMLPRLIRSQIVRGLERPA